MSEVLVVPTGTANLASVLAGLRRAGLSPRLELDPRAITEARAVVLPGVGHYRPALARLRETGADAAIVTRIQQLRPTLAICLGLQVLAEGSDEAPDTPGLGAIVGRATRFDADVRCPHLGWTPVRTVGPTRLLEPGIACFAHSYRLVAPPPGWGAAMADHGGPFVAAIERGPVLACQLHPELSGHWGQGLLARWARVAVEV